GDSYMAGLECQWVDITGAQSPAALTFTVNPDGYLCEGIPGSLCQFSANWQANDSASIPLDLPPTGSLVTAPCTRGEIGPLRECGFSEQPNKLTCNPGERVQLMIRASTPQIVRICEYSAALGTGVACVYRQSLANVIVEN